MRKIKDRNFLRQAIFSLLSGAALSSFLIFTWLPAAIPPANAVQEKSKGGDAPKGGDEGPKNLGADESYVRENLKKFLNPLNLEFLQDGRVKMEFLFYDKESGIGKIFDPNIGSKKDDRFRWSSGNEPMGLCVYDKGMALLNCWFKDEVEAGVKFSQRTNFLSRHTFAVIFANDNNLAIGSNFGSQCVVYSKGALKESRGKPEPTMQNFESDLRLVVGNGKFEARLGNNNKEALSYSPKSFASGRVGFLWAGLTAGNISGLEVTGRIDASRTLQAMRKIGFVELPETQPDKPKENPPDKKSGAGSPESRPEANEKEKPKKEKKEDDVERPARELTVDETYIKDNLEKCLVPDSVEFLKDGRVKLFYSFFKKRNKHTLLFEPNISSQSDSNFRWIEEFEPILSSGLRIGKKGMALFNCWFADDLEAEIDYTYAASDPHTFALVFASDKKAAFGNNLGTQCVSYSDGAAKETKGIPEPVKAGYPNKIKLLARDGKFEAYLNGKLKGTMAYSRKAFESGRIGFLWSGAVAGSVQNLQITGKIDAARMVKEIQKLNK